jgi:hypothetical protein
MRARCALAFLAIGILAFEVAGCACTSDIKSSLRIFVVDSTGSAITDATVTYSVDDGPTQDCNNAPNSNEFYCAQERAGDFLITVSRGATKKTQSLEVDEDYCHVETETITITLGT